MRFSFSSFLFIRDRNAAYSVTVRQVLYTANGDLIHSKQYNSQIDEYVRFISKSMLVIDGHVACRNM